MVTVVIVLNVLISVILLFVAWQVWQLRLRLSQIADTLANVERSSHLALRGTPSGIYKGQQGIHKLRQGREPLQRQLQQVQQVLSLFFVGQQAWLRFIGVRRSPLGLRSAQSQLSRQDLAKYK